MSNKYLEKIASRLNAIKTGRTGMDVYQLHGATKKNKKKKAAKAAQASRKWNRGVVRKQD